MVWAGFLKVSWVFVTQQIQCDAPTPQKGLSVLYTFSLLIWLLIASKHLYGCSVKTNKQNRYQDLVKPAHKIYRRSHGNQKVLGSNMQKGNRFIDEKNSRQSKAFGIGKRRRRGEGVSLAGWPWWDHVVGQDDGQLTGYNWKERMAFRHIAGYCE